VVEEEAQAERHVQVDDAEDVGPDGGVHRHTTASRSTSHASSGQHWLSFGVPAPRREEHAE
jgi:hypothetical protein